MALNTVTANGAVDASDANSNNNCAGRANGVYQRWNLMDGRYTMTTAI